MATPHKHADNMLLFAQDAQLTDTPWLWWEYCYDSSPEDWRPLGTTPAWTTSNNYRRKPPAQKYITIGNIEVPEPLRVAPEPKTLYWYVNSMGVYSECWSNYSKVDSLRLELGIVHLTEDAARLHRDALIRSLPNNQPGH